MALINKIQTDKQTNKTKSHTVPPTNKTSQLFVLKCVAGQKKRMKQDAKMWTLTLCMAKCASVSIWRRHIHTKVHTFSSYVYGHWFWCTYKSKIASFHLLRTAAQLINQWMIRPTSERVMRYTSNGTTVNCMWNTVFFLSSSQHSRSLLAPFYGVQIVKYSLTSNCMNCYNSILYIYRSCRQQQLQRIQNRQEEKMCINKFYCRHSNNTRLKVVTKWKFYKRSVSYDLISINHSFHS